MEGNVWNRNKRRNRYQRSWNASDTEKVYVRDRFVAPILPWWRTPRVLSVVLTFLLIGWAALLLWHPYFFLRHITVEAQETKNPEQYRDAILSETKKTGALSLRGNFFLFSVPTLEQNLRDQFAVQTLQIEKKFPNTLVVRLVEKSDSIVAAYQGRIVRITTQGVVSQLASIPTPSVTAKAGEGSGVATTTTSTPAAPTTAVPVSVRAQLFAEGKKLNAPTLVLQSWNGEANASPIPTSLFSKFIDFTTLTKSEQYRERGGVPRDELQYLVYDPAGDPYTLGHVVLDSRRGGAEITYWYDLRNSFESQNDLLFEYLRLQKTPSYRQLDLRRPGEVILMK